MNDEYFMDVVFVETFRHVRPILSGNDEHSKMAYEHRFLQWERDVNHVADALKKAQIPNYDADKFRMLCYS